MTISNVVLDRDEQIVTFDTVEHEGWTAAVSWDNRELKWHALSANRYRKEIDEALLGVAMIFERGKTEPKPDQEPTPSYYNKAYKGIKLDPYRVCKIYDINGGPREHIIKKLLRGTNKGDGINHDLELIDVVEGQLKRWKEMLKEDAE